MSQSGFTPIKLYASSTASAVPLAANLDNTNGAELAVNTTDEKLYLKNSSGVVKLLASNAGATGTVTSVAATVPSFLSVTGSPITTAGTLAIAYSGTALPVANGGTGVTTSTGTGNTVLSTSPTLVTPTLGTPASVTLTNATGLPISTGVSGLGAGVATFLATPSSANLASAVTDETGTGALVFANSPTLVTPALGTPASATLTNATGLPLSTGVTGTLAVANGGTGVTTSTGSGSNVLSTSPTLVTPVLGTPTSVTLTNATGLPLTTGTTGILAVANGGSGTATPSLVAGSNVTISGTWPNQTVAATGGGTAPAGSNTQVQFNNAGAFGGSSNLTWNGSLLSISGARFGSNNSLGTAFVGKNALLNNTTGTNNNAFGATALQANTTGQNNNAFGSGALFSNGSGNGNVAIGENAMDGNSSGSYNVGIGVTALLLNNGNQNTAVGYQASFTNSTGGYNSAYGVRALYGNTTGSYNLGIGIDALSALTTGSGNIGFTSVNSTGVYSPVFNVTTESNRIVMGPTSATNAYIQVAWTVVSDLRDKAILGDVPHGLEFVKKLKPITYKFKESRDSDETVGMTKYGFGAQDVLALEGDEPVIVDIEQPEKLKLTDQHLLPIFSNAIRELAEQVEQLKAEIAALKVA